MRACCGENMVKHYASDEEIDRARQLRRASTEVETRLWQHLRARQMAGHKFRRQHMVEGYIADFAAPMQKLILELDGGQHNDATHGARDAARTATLEKSGWQVLRFWNNEVMENMDGVLRVIDDALTRKT